MPTESRGLRSTVFVSDVNDVTGKKYNYSKPVVRRYEQITGYRGPRRPGSLNPCNHTKIMLNLGSVNAYDGKSQRTVGTPPISATYTEAGVAYLQFAAGVAISPTDSLALMSAMAGEVQPVVSVPNMILELPQTLSLWGDLVGPLQKLVKRASGVRGRFRNGSCALLAQQFGLFPLIGDLTTLLTSTKTVHSEVKRLTTLPAEWSNHKISIPASSASASLAINGSTSFGTASLSNVSARATAYVAYKRKRAKQLDGTVLASHVGRALYGFSNPGEVLWEATPFSFVADWFYPIGDYLGSLSSSMLKDVVTWKSPVTCVRAEASADLMFRRGSGPITGCGSVLARAFVRSPGLPSSAPPLDSLGIPGLRQFVLGGALALQR